MLVQVYNILFLRFYSKDSLLRLETLCKLQPPLYLVHRSKRMLTSIAVNSFVHLFSPSFHFGLNLASSVDSVGKRNIRAMATEEVRFYDRDDEFWRTYAEGRPEVPQSFFDRIFRFHEQHCGRFQSVHDVGAGAGMHSSRLAECFEKVIVSDVSQSNIAVAQNHLQGDQYEFRVEDVESSTVADKSVDMIFAAVMLHMTDLTRAFEAIGRQLRAGGTFVAAFFGLATLTDPHLQAIWSKLYRKASEKTLHRLIQNGSKGVVELQASGWDAVPLPQKYFRPGGMRVKINDSSELLGGVWRGQMMSPEVTTRVPYVSRISNDEEVMNEVDESWAFHKTLVELKALLDTLPLESETEPDEISACWTELEQAVPSGETVPGCWPVTLLMATRI